MEREGLTPDVIANNLKAAQKRRDEALADYQTALAEVEWWRQGQRLFGIEPELEDELDPAKIRELFPPAWVFTNGTEPTLRQAIIATMREAPGMRWSVSGIVAGLQQEGWLPEREDAAKRVSDMAGAMANDGQLERAERGVYVLAPELAAALQTQLLGDEKGAPAEADTP